MVGGSRRPRVVGEGARRRRATTRKVAGRSDGESATPTSECGVRDCCVESKVGVGGGREGRCNGREASQTCRHRPPVSGRDFQRPSRAFAGGFHAYVRRRNHPMDARSTSRFARCNVDRECHRSVEVVPRHGRCSHFVFEESHSPVLVGQHRCVNVRCALYGLRGVRVGEAQNPGPAHAKRRRRVSDSEVSSTFLDGLEADLRHDVTQLSPTVPASSGAIARFVGRNITPVGVEGHRAASRRLVLVGDLNTPNSPVPETHRLCHPGASTFRRDSTPQQFRCIEEERRRQCPHQWSRSFLRRRVRHRKPPGFGSWRWRSGRGSSPPWKRDPELSPLVWRLWTELTCPRSSIIVHTR